MLMVRESLRQFVREHISEPFWGIYNELVHNQPLTMTDAKALADSSHRFVHAPRFAPFCVAHHSCFVQMASLFVAHVRNAWNCTHTSNVLACMVLVRVCAQRPARL